jgi:hypothetical protein
MSRTRRVYNKERKSMYRYGEDHEFYHPYAELSCQYPEDKQRRRLQDKMSRRADADRLIELETSFDS